MQAHHTLKALASSLIANAAIAVALGLSLSPAAYADDLAGNGLPFSQAQAPAKAAQGVATADATLERKRYSRETQLPTSAAQSIAATR